MENENYINVYRINHCYGGPEEGGWYYDALECLASVEIDRLPKPRRRTLLSLLRDQYPNKLDMGDDEARAYQGDSHEVFIENRKAERETREIPRYE